MASRANRARLRLVEAAPEAGSAEADATGSTPVPGLSATQGWDTRRSTPPDAPPEVPVPSGRRAVGAALNPRASALADLPDAQLVALGCKGETHALELLYRRHAQFAIHLAARIEG